MTYIYDIILNFQKNYYQFFEWKTNDKITNYSKIPLYHVSDKDILNLKDNNVKVKFDFIKKIKNDNKTKQKIICIISNGKIAIAVLFDNKGNLKKRSSLIFEEEEEALNLSKNLIKTPIKYEKIIKNKNKNILRLEKEKKSLVTSYIKNNKNLTTLKYLYYECYEKETNDLTVIKEKLLKELSKEWNDKHKRIYEIIKLLIKN